MSATYDYTRTESEVVNSLRVSAAKIDLTSLSNLFLPMNHVSDVQRLLVLMKCKCFLKNHKLIS